MCYFYTSLHVIVHLTQKVKRLVTCGQQCVKLNLNSTGNVVLLIIFCNDELLIKDEECELYVLLHTINSYTHPHTIIRNRVLSCAVAKILLILSYYMP